MKYKEIIHEIEYINLKNINYDLKKEIIVKDYNNKLLKNKIIKLTKIMKTYKLNHLI